MAGFIIPYYFATNPAMLLNVVAFSWPGVIQSVLAATVGTVAISMALQGFGFRSTNWFGRILLGAAAVVPVIQGWTSLGVSLLIVIGFLVYQRTVKPPGSMGPSPTPA